MLNDSRETELGLSTYLVHGTCALPDTSTLVLVHALVLHVVPTTTR